MSSPISPTSISSSQPATSNRRPSSNSRAPSSSTSTQPTRNKSSSALSNYSNTSTGHTSTHSNNTNKPKRNKSSSSLSSHAHGHHGVQFSHGHHGSSNNLARSSGSSGNRRSSTGRKAAVDFGFTSLVKEVVNAPPPPPPTATVAKPKSKSKIIVDDSDSEEDSDDDQEEEEDKTIKYQQDEIRRGSDSTIKSSKSTKSETLNTTTTAPVIPVTSIQPPTPLLQEVPLPLPLPVQVEETPNSNRGRGRMTSRTQALAERPEAISYTSGGSDWESAVDSPAGPERNARERVSRERSSRERSSRERNAASGRKEGSRDSLLGGGAPGGSGIRVDTSLSRLNDTSSGRNSRERNHRSVTPPIGAQVGQKKNGNGGGRATFQVGSVGGEFSPMSRSYEQLQQIQKPNTILATIPHLLQSTVTDSSTILEAQPTRSSSSNSRHSTRNMTPPPPLPGQPSFVAAAAAAATVSNNNQSGSSRMQPSAATIQPPQLQPQQHQSVPFPSTEPHSPIPSTSGSKPYFPRTTRVPSSASLLSIASNRSIAHSLSQFGSPTVSRRSIGIAPALDRTSIARAEMIMGGGSSYTGSTTGFGGEGGGISDRHRLDSMSSLRSLAAGTSGQESGGIRSNFTGGIPGRRAATLNSSEGKDALRRLRMSQSISEGGNGVASGSGSGGAMAALGSLQQRDRTTNTTSSTSGADLSGFTQAKRTASGYFASLRGLTSIATGFSPPIAPTSPNTAGSRYSSDNNSPTNIYSNQSKGKSRLPIPSTPHIVISKFLDPPSVVPPLNSSSSHPSTSRSSDSPPPINNYSGALPKSPLGGHEELMMSRTQQKALLARDAPFWSGSVEPNSSTSSSSMQQAALLPLPPSSVNSKLVATTTNNNKIGTQSTEREIGMQKWAAGLVREAERIERQYRAVETWRDPLGESLERVLSGRNNNSLNNSVEFGTGSVVKV